MEERTYECPECGNLAMGDMPPECCGRPMLACTFSVSAERARPMEYEEPCDDSRSG